MSVFIISLIRTVVPIVVGSFIAWLVTLGLTLPPEAEQGAVTVITGTAIALYYIGVRYLETKFPAFGWLIGVARSPDSYSNDGKPPITVDENKDLTVHTSSSVRQHMVDPARHRDPKHRDDNL